MCGVEVRRISSRSCERFFFVLLLLLLYCCESEELDIKYGNAQVCVSSLSVRFHVLMHVKGPVCEILLGSLTAQFIFRPLSGGLP